MQNQLAISSQAKVSNGESEGILEEFKIRVRDLEIENGNLLKIKEQRDKLQKEFDDFKKKFSGLESRVVELTDENQRLLQQVNSGIGLDKETESLRDRVKQYEQQIRDLMGQLSNGNSIEKIVPGSPARDHETVISRTVTRVVRSNEKISASQQGTIITEIKKARIINSLVTRLCQKRSQIFFNTLLRSCVRSKVSIG